MTKHELKMKRPLSDLYVLTRATAASRDAAVELFESLGTPINRRVIVTTDLDPAEDISGTTLYYDDIDPKPNFSKWWSLGLDDIASRYPEDTDYWDVLIVTPDARISKTDLSVMRNVMRGADCVMAGVDNHSILMRGQAFVRRDNTPWLPKGFRMDQTSLSRDLFLVAGETGLRYHPLMSGVLAEADFEWQHRMGGGTVLVGGTTSFQRVRTLKGEELEQYGSALRQFADKWGSTMNDAPGVYPATGVAGVL